MPIQKGLEPIFHIITPEGPVLNMFRTPGLISPEVLKTWIKDLTTDGVWDHTDPDNPTRFPVCPYDVENLGISGQAVLASCTEGLKQRIKDAVQPKDRNGPTLFYDLLKKVYTPTTSRVNTLKKQLQALDITKYPAENITSFCTDAQALVREIQMNFLLPDQVPDLTMIALTGLKTSSDSWIRDKARKTRVEATKVGFGRNPKASVADPIDILNEFDDLYRELVDGDDYAPADTKPKATAHQAQIQALQAQVQQLETKLQQDRTAKSTTGNSNGGRTNSSYGGRSNPADARRNGTCRRCNKEGHFAGDPECPLKDVPRHGLDPATVKTISAKAKEIRLTMPPRANVSDDDMFCVYIDNKKAAAYCRHCDYFTKGATMHTTKEHKGTKNLCPYAGPPPAPAPAPAPLLVLHLHPALHLKSVAAWPPSPRV